MYIDPMFRDYFDNRLRQVFLYITDLCGLHCEQCLYKTTLANREMDLDTTLELIKIFRDYGAEKLTFIGGEPTLYGIMQNNEPLYRVIETARDLGYEYIRLDTNGQSKLDILDQPQFKRLNNLSFSLDGHNAEINDEVRGRGTFDKCVRMLQRAVSLGYYVSVTSCVHRGNLHHLEETIEFVTELGVKEFNLHPLFKMGIARDHFSGDTDISPIEWMREHDRLWNNIDRGKYQIPVRVPRRFIKTTDYLANPDSYDYCPVRMGERVLVHPNGEIRICALCIGSPYHIASYTQDRIQLGAQFSEISEERLKRRPCMSQIKDFGDLTPLCISYKPFQNEYVWTTQHVDENMFGLQTSFIPVQALESSLDSINNME
jgi:MoaA/NifB/PqqE/SkfB family radical SAM enzyme